MQAKFIGGLAKKIQYLVQPISQGHGQQSGQALAGFVQLINRHADFIDQLSFMETHYLWRHYTHNNPRVSLDTNWALRNHDVLSQLHVNWTLTDWQSVVEHADYSRHFNCIKNDYSTETAFTEIIHRLAKPHQDKAGLDAAIDYLLEECAGLLVLMQEGKTITYPSDLNLALRYTLKKYVTTANNETPHFIGFRLKAAPNVDNADTPKSADTFAQILAQCIQENLAASPEAQKRLLNDLQRLRHSDASTSIQSNKEHSDEKGNPLEQHRSFNR